jgi:hypothetical protein
MLVFQAEHNILMHPFHMPKYLLFVELEPGDVVVEFIESEILKD